MKPRGQAPCLPYPDSILIDLKAAGVTSWVSQGGGCGCIRSEMEATKKGTEEEEDETETELPKASEIEYVSYGGEHHLPLIMNLVDQELSEPYSIFTYRYFVYLWPQLSFLVLSSPSPSPSPYLSSSNYLLYVYLYAFSFFCFTPLIWHNLRIALLALIRFFQNGLHVFDDG